jgi:enoyl-CoA hydratase/carnithine racemase
MRTKDLVLTAREFTGEQAGEWGLATEVVPADELDTAVDRLAEAVVTTPRLVVEQVLAEVDRLAEAAASTADAAPDIERMLAAGQDEGCRSARDIYLAQWRDRRAGGG